MPDDPASVPAPLPGPSRTPQPDVDRSLAGAVIAVIVAAPPPRGRRGVVAWRGAAARDERERARTRPRRDVRRPPSLPSAAAQSDLVAPRAAAASFQAPAQAAIAANAHLVDLEVQLADRLNRLRQAAASRDIGTYNRIVRELNASKRERPRRRVHDLGPAQGLLRSARRAADGAVQRQARADDHVDGYGGNGLQCARLRRPARLRRAPRRARSTSPSCVGPPSDPKASLGPLVLNPGGPGASGIAFMRDAILLLPPELLAALRPDRLRPRGVGHSSRSTAPTTSIRSSTRPHLAGARRATMRRSARSSAWWPGAPTRTGTLLHHVDTVSTAHDMDRIRAVLSASSS